MPDAQFGNCLFCMDAEPTASFRVRREFDYSGVPTGIADMVRRAKSGGFTACEACARLVRAKDVDGLHERVYDLQIRDKGKNAAEQRARSARAAAANLWQTVFWLGLSTDFGPIVAIARFVLPAERMFFDLLNAADPTMPYASFKNGVIVYGWPWGKTFLIEDIISTRRGERRAAQVLRFVVALADVHGVTIRGTVEAHVVGGRPSSLNDAELHAWYARHGFVSDPRNAPNGVVRYPSPDPNADDLSERVRRAQSALA